MSLLKSLTLLTAFLAPTLALPAPEHHEPRATVIGATVCNNGQLAAANPRAAFLRQVLDNTCYTNYTKRATPKDVPFKVGIIGGGAAGLYAAMLLDSLDIDYDIHEASDRVGGRIFTYYFDKAAWDKSTPADPAYYDYYVSGGTTKTPDTVH
jgi:putative NAD(P)-binding protein